MHGVGVGGGMHGDGGDAQFAAGALDAQRDFAAVGDEDLLNMVTAPQLDDDSGSPNSTGAPEVTRISRPCRRAAP